LGFGGWLIPVRPNLGDRTRVELQSLATKEDPERIKPHLSVSITSWKSGLTQYEDLQAMPMPNVNNIGHEKADHYS
jgi:hypothetical protein